MPASSEIAPGRRPGSRTIVMVVLLGAVIAAAAWWRLAGPSPNAVAQAYLAAEDREDAGAVYDLLSSESKEMLGPKEAVLARLIAPVPPGIGLNVTRRLKSVTLDPLGESAMVEAEVVIKVAGGKEELRSRRTFYLTREGGAWRVDGLTVVAPATPPAGGGAPSRRLPLSPSMPRPAPSPRG